MAEVIATQISLPLERFSSTIQFVLQSVAIKNQKSAIR